MLKPETASVTVLLEPPSLLITDDDRDLREALGEVFASRGFRTLLACDGEQAVEIVNREQVHLMLLDMHMPKLSGLETVRRVKQMYEVLPCILMSAALDDDIAAEARRLNLFSVQSKPFRFAELSAVVHQAMRQFYNWRPAGH